MRVARVGRSGLSVSKLCLGTWLFGDPTPEAEARHIMRTAFEAGIFFWDTSNHYNLGGSEEVVGRGLRELGIRDQVVLATKVFYPTRRGGPNDRGAGRRHLTQELEAQLRRLQTDWIDIYYLHRSDFDTPLDETISTLDGLVKAGKIRYWGMSTFPGWRMAEAWWRCDRRGWSYPLCDQAAYNLLDRRLENERIPFIREYGLGLITWSSLAAGLLSGKYTVDSMVNPPPGTRLERLNERYRTRVDQSGLGKAVEIAEFARQAGLHPIHLAVAWQIHDEVVSSAVIGPRTLDQLSPYIEALDVTLDASMLAEIDRIVPPGSAFADFHDTSGWYVGPLTRPLAMD
jgi:1-deoxyxylulose-5-phosphate synthase